MEPAKQPMTEHAHLAELQDDLKRKLEESQRQDHGRTDSLRASILSLVVGENYTRGRDELQAYVNLKTAFPHFQQRVERVVQHCAELIHAIETKRNFPGLGSLSLAKQQEIYAKVLEHFEDLKRHLQQIENVEREQKLNDVRSTVWVLRACCLGAAAILVAAFMLELKQGVFGSIVIVTESLVDDVSSWVVSFIKI